MGIKKTYIDEKGRKCTRCKEYKTWEHYHKDNSPGYNIPPYKAQCIKCIKEKYKLSRKRT